MTVMQRRLLRWYRRSGRASLPWRVERSPYRTVVSEFMLAQTQVERVVPKFESFVRRFPDFGALARASPAEVLREWKGLGYNSRAVRLQRLAKEVAERHDGVLPSERTILRSLSGIGTYTAAAIRAFAFGLEDAPLDTNIRRIVHRLCFGIEHPRIASEADLGERARAMIPRWSAHDWNSALMDLGATVCTARAPKCLLCPLKADCAAAPIDAAQLDRSRKASAKRRPPQMALPFARTTRYARGRIVDRLRDLPPGQRISLMDLHRAVGASLPERSLEDLHAFVAALERDGLVSHDGNGVALQE
jgi:A/G-specific adenine glycosylase